MHIGIIGAGFAGLSHAKVLREFGFDVTVFDKTPDVGGVWSRTRRYPGLTTQNNRSTYALSDFPMPASYPEWPSGEQVQAYLEAYVRHAGLAPFLRLSTEVVSADLDEAAGRWTLQVRPADGGTGGTEGLTVDYLVVANGIFSDQLVPEYPGAAEYRAAGGRLCHASEFHELEDAGGKDILVVG